MTRLTSSATGKIGETLVMLELEKRGWMVYLPHFEEKVDIVAAKATVEGFRHVDFQVKTSNLTKARGYTFTVHHRKILRSTDFFFVWCCIEDISKGKVVFYVTPSVDLPQIMSQEFNSPTWHNTGAYTFKLPGKKWEPYRDKFPE